MLSLQKCDLQVNYHPGCKLVIADTLSRLYLQETRETLGPDLEVNEAHLTAHLPISPAKYAEFQKAAAEDQDMQALKCVVINGWPSSKTDLLRSIRQYWSCKHEISYIDDLLFKSHKLIVPQCLRKEMFELIHESHQGIVKCKQRARGVLFWPVMSTQIERVSKCPVCSQFQRANPKEPMMIQELPERPWYKIGSDLLEFNGFHYLIIVDDYSKWIEIGQQHSLTSTSMICHLKRQIARHGISD